MSRTEVHDLVNNLKRGKVFAFPPLSLEDKKTFWGPELTWSPIPQITASSQEEHDLELWWLVCTTRSTNNSWVWWKKEQNLEGIGVLLFFLWFLKHRNIVLPSCCLRANCHMSGTDVYLMQFYSHPSVHVHSPSRRTPISRRGPHKWSMFLNYCSIPMLGRK